MFGDMMGMMGKLKEAQKKMEEAKGKMDTLLITHESPDGALKLTLTANRALKNIEIDPKLLEDKEQLEDLLLSHFNKAILKATALNDKEMAEVAKDGLPNILG